MENRNQVIIDGLNKLISFIQTNNDVDFMLMCEAAGPVELKVYSWYAANAKKEFVADFARRMGASTKTFSDSFAWIRKDFGPMARLELAIEREIVCERVVVGTKDIPATPEMVLPATPARTEDIVEWKCGSVLALAGAE